MRPSIFNQAVENNNLPVVTLLLSLGACFYIKDVNGKEPLLIAAKRGHIEIIQELFNHGASKLRPCSETRALDPNIAKLITKKNTNCWFKKKENLEKYDSVCNVLIMGDRRVGKKLFLAVSSGTPILSYEENLYFVRKLEDLNKKIPIEITVQHSIPYPLSITRTSCVIFIYDITQQSSFNSVEQWIKVLSNERRKPKYIFIVANKSDCETDRQVSKESVKDLMNDYPNIIFNDISATTGFNVYKLLNQMVDMILSDTKHN